MKTFLHVLILSFALQTLSAQNTLPNPGFENWVDAGGIFNSYQNPVDWGTLNDASSFLGILTATKATAPQYVKSGNAALKLETFFITLLNRPAQGLCVTGTVNTQTEQVEGGLPYNLRPQAFSGWYQYYPVGADTASVVAVFTKWNGLTQQRDTVGFAGQWFTEQVSQYDNFQIPVEYYLEENPDTVMVILVSSSQIEPGIGSVMYIDDLSFDFTTETNLESQLPKFEVFPNPANNYLQFVVPNARQIEIVNTSGIRVKTGLIGKNSEIAVGDLPVGMYFAVFLDERGEPLGISKFVVGR